MNSPKLPTSLTPSSDLVTQLRRLRLLRTAESLDDLLARASTQHWSPRQLLEEVARTEPQDLARRSLERRLAQARLRRFKPLADFEWTWPKKIDRPLIEPVLTLDFLSEPRNCVIIGSNGLGKEVQGEGAFDQGAIDFLGPMPFEVGQGFEAAQARLSEAAFEAAAGKVLGFRTGDFFQQLPRAPALRGGAGQQVVQGMGGKG